MSEVFPIPDHTLATGLTWVTYSCGVILKSWGRPGLWKKRSTTFVHVRFVHVPLEEIIELYFKCLLSRIFYLYYRIHIVLSLYIPFIKRYFSTKKKRIKIITTVSNMV